MSIEKMLHIAKEELREISNNRMAEFSDKQTAIQTYLLAEIAMKLDVKEHKQQEVMKDRRLIITLSCGYNIDPTLLEKSIPLMDAREKVFKFLFAQKFPDAPKFQENKHCVPDYVDWKYWIVGITERQIEWTLAAYSCGLIDTYVVDYADEQEVAE